MPVDTLAVAPPWGNDEPWWLVPDRAHAGSACRVLAQSGHWPKHRCRLSAKGRHSRAIHWRCSPVDLRHPGGGARSEVRIVLPSAFKRPSSARGSIWKRPKYRSRSVVAGWRCEAAESFFNELREGERGLVPPLRGDRLIADRQARTRQPGRTDRRG